ncbi:MAG: radical SAM protein [Thermoprotei archaeon]|nr:MAG: radical SAM protein [Thermoprotei archaeon]RLE98913.1 MAG: radical SAM protein [Thermoprotei archaeon]HDI74594.1 radical SAM protein [Thermoprotei archaeon]
MSVIREFDPWRSPLCTCPPKYSLSPYTGCGHHCLYCYASSYIKDFYRVRVKKNILSRLKRDLRKIDKRKVISMSNSSDPYTPPEEHLGVTRKVLKTLISAGCKVLIVTKSDLVLRDLDIIRRGKVSVSITVTTLDEKLAKIIEPRAPAPSRRIKALAELTRNSIPVSARIDPIIPYINDYEESIKRLVSRLSEAGVLHVVTSTYKARPDSLKRLESSFLNLKSKLKTLYRIRGEKLCGYWYLNRRLREDIIKTVRDVVLAYGMTFASCREGLSYLNTAICDGSHLIDLIKAR